MKQRKLALSMRGGGAKCLSYLGLLKLLEEEDIKAHYIVGSSGGAIVGGGYAAGIPIDKILEHASKISARTFTSFHSLWHWDVADQTKVGPYIRQLLGDFKAEDTKIPFWGQVTNMDEGKAELLNRGDLVQIMQASMAYPFLANPIKINGTLYGDGDLAGGYETQFLRSQGADVVIGLKAPLRVFKKHSIISTSIAEPILITRKVMLELYSKIDPPDLLIDKFSEGIGGTLDFEKAYEFYQQGYELSKLYWPQIKELLFHSKTYFFFKKILSFEI